MKIFLKLNICFLLLYCIPTQAQEFWQNMRIEPSLNYGRIIPHRTYFDAKVTENTMMYELSLTRKGRGNKNWHHLFNYPLAGVNIIGVQFGDSETFGKGVAAFPFIQFHWNLKKIGTFNLRVGSGIALINDKYDEVENPTNNAISVHLNNITRLSFGLERDFTSRLGAKLMFSATHFSNGNIHQPNLGLNLFSGNLGVYYYLTEKEQQVAKQREEVNKDLRFLFRTTYGQTSGRVPTGLFYHVGTAALLVAKSLNHQGRFLAGVQYEFNESIYSHAKEEYNEEDDLGILASKVCILAGYEMMMGRLGMTFQGGVYILNKDFEPVSYFKRPAFLNILGVHYYLRHPETVQHHLPFLTIQLKAHGARADFVSFGLGWQF